MEAFFVLPLSAQTTAIQLPSADSSSSFRVSDNTGAVVARVNGDGGFFLKGVYGSGVMPASGAGTRMVWSPRRAAFRAGQAAATEWDDSTIGAWSVAFGYGTRASGPNSAAIGDETQATGPASFAIGSYTIAGAQNSLAAGQFSSVTGLNSLAFGTSASASGGSCVALGNSVESSGASTMAFGDHVVASGNWSTAMGTTVSSNGKTGACIIGDSYAPTPTTSSADNEMTMRFAGGYRLFTAYALTGVSLSAGATSWSTVSDSTKKTNFLTTNGEYFLSSLSHLKLGSWNYKIQDQKTFRHYGPMAQEIFHYFGKDQLGTIGNDTTLASADMDGIMMVCLQALEKRTSELQKAQEKICALETSLNKLSAVVQALVDERKKVCLNAVERKEQ